MGFGIQLEVNASHIDSHIISVLNQRAAEAVVVFVFNEPGMIHLSMRMASQNNVYSGHFFGVDFIVPDSHVMKADDKVYLRTQLRHDLIGRCKGV